MKTLVQDYIFDAANKRVIFTKVTPAALEEMLLITNVTTGDIIYNFADKLRVGTLVGNVLTLTTDTTSMSNTDSLQIFIDTNDFQESQMRMLATLVRNMSYARDSNDRMRIISDGGSVSVYSRNSTAWMGGSTESWYSAGAWSTMDAREQMMEQSKASMMTKMQRWTRT